MGGERLHLAVGACILGALPSLSLACAGQSKKGIFRVFLVYERDTWMFKAGVLIQTPFKKGRPKSDGLKVAYAQTSNRIEAGLAGSIPQD